MITIQIETGFIFVIPAQAGIQFFSFFSVSSAKPPRRIFRFAENAKSRFSDGCGGHRRTPFCVPYGRCGLPAGR
jgi:hypothetical protein